MVQTANKLHQTKMPLCSLVTLWYSVHLALVKCNLHHLTFCVTPHLWHVKEFSYSCFMRLSNYLLLSSLSLRSHFLSHSLHTLAYKRSFHWFSTKSLFSQKIRSTTLGYRYQVQASCSDLIIKFNQTKPRYQTQRPLSTSVSWTQCYTLKYRYHLAKFNETQPQNQVQSNFNLDYEHLQIDVYQLCIDRSALTQPILHYFPNDIKQNRKKQNKNLKLVSWARGVSMNKLQNKLEPMPISMKITTNDLEWN